MPLIKIFMKFFVKIKTKSANPGIEKIGESDFIVKVKELPTGGRANKAVVKALAEYFKVASWRVKIVGGIISKNKVVNIIE